LKGGNFLKEASSRSPGGATVLPSPDRPPRLGRGNPWVASILGIDGPRPARLALGAMPQGEPLPRNGDWPRCGASAAVFRGEAVLLIVRAKGALKGLWSLPGGHIEPGETARAAAQREVLEETGVEADIDALVDVHDVILRSAEGALSAHYLIAVFCGRWRRGEPNAGSDAFLARFVPLGDVEGLELTDGAAPLIRRAWALVKMSSS
jgi:8-oxo-dGTP diphosphatase